jgi:hypothetical protein
VTCDGPGPSGSVSTPTLLTSTETSLPFTGLPARSLAASGLALIGVGILMLSMNVKRRGSGASG